MIANPVTVTPEIATLVSTPKGLRVRVTVTVYNAPHGKSTYGNVWWG
mgnify:CR=1 FL=1|jgi:hypothetical protein